MSKLLIICTTVAALALGGLILTPPDNAGVDGPVSVNPDTTDLVSIGFINAQPVCKSEDDETGCGWNAAENGNGVGCSFYADRTGGVWYTTAECRDK